MPAVRQRRGEARGEALRARELLQEVAPEARRHVERVEDERRERHRAEHGGEAERAGAEHHGQERGHPVAVELPGRAAPHVRGRHDEHGGERDQGHERLEQHRAVAHGLAVALARDLLARRAPADEAVEARARAARDRDEEEREHRREVAGRRRAQGRLLDRVPAEEDPDHARREREVEHEAAEEPAGLEEQATGSSDATTQYARIATNQVRSSRRTSVETAGTVPSATHPSVSGTKTTARTQVGGAKRFCTTPMTTASSRYEIAAAATPPPLWNGVSPGSSSTRPRNVPAVTCVNATIT